MRTNSGERHFPKPLTGEGGVVADKSLKAVPGTELTVWEKRVQNMTPEQQVSRKFWDVKDRTDYRARHGRLPWEAPVTTVAAARNGKA